MFYRGVECSLLVFGQTSIKKVQLYYVLSSFKVSEVSTHFANFELRIFNLTDIYLKKENQVISLY